MTSAFLLRPGEGPEVTALGSTYVTKTDGAHVADAYSLTEESFWADTTPLHTHVGSEEAFYVLAGEVEAWIDGVRTTAAPGAFIVVPRGVPHGLRRLSSSPVRMLTLVSPPGFEKLFEVVATQGEDALVADPETLVDLAARFGTEILADYPD
jgi:mannose-6-phosphate isomerase-like protein (cupin superfamily)